MSKITRVFFDPLTGRIKNFVVASSAFIPPEEVGPPEWIITDEIPHPPTQYVVDGAIVPRPANPARFVASTRTLKDLPIPCRILVNSTTYECSDATAELDLGPGEYRITVIAWPYLDDNFTIRV